ncbi:hypothetical protein [Nocardioides sp.]|uniref:hypothetical protein n=1 Tax=Nocardioides sp. TaxID=35761 RepID=UPI002EDAA8D9
MHHLLGRAAVVLAVPALSLTTLGALAPSAQAAQAAPDPAPAAASAAWLAGQLTDGVLHNDQYDFDDYGLSIDAALALHAVGGQDAAVQAVSDRLAANLASYTSPGYGTVLSAGGTAKALVLAQAAGDDPTSYGGANLVDQLEGRVATGGSIAGRIQDDVDTTQAGAADYANVIGQAYAVQGLDAAGSTSTAAATDFLLAQQCAGGWFRLYFADADAAGQSCDADATASADTDVTAIAVLSLLGQADDADVATHLDAAEQWLLDAQRANGSFGGGTSTEAPNANSTGLAGWALGALGDTEAAADAAAWVRAHQAANVANCVYYDAGDLGAIAYDDAARRTLQGTPIDASTQDQFRRATAQSLPALQFAPAGTGDPHALFAAEYVKAGGKKPVGVIGAAPGEALCATLGEQSVLGHATKAGEGTLRVRIPSRTATSKVTVANAAGAFGTVKIRALGAKTLPFTLKRVVAVGEKQVVKVRGLAPGELFSIQITWSAKRSSGSGEGVAGQANRKGVAVLRTKVPRRFGKATVKIRGQFGNRKAAGSFTVTR